MSQQYPQFQPAEPVQAPKKKHTGRNILLAIGAFVGVLVVIGIASGGSDDQGDAAKAGATVPKVVTSLPVATQPTKTTTAQPTEPAATQAPEVTQPAITTSQEQAVGSAESYLKMTAFSRKGLIRQLSSSAGEGFSVADATYAVDHIEVDWNEQAAKSAKSYLQMTNFSRAGLIRQLESSAGEGFTNKQAVYGVNKAGL